MSRALPALGAFLYIAGSCLWAYLYPQSALGFFCFETSLLVLYLVPAPRAVKYFLGGVTLLVLMPLLGWSNTYYLEIAVQIGIFVVLAMGLNIVVGFCGLLNLGFVAFYAIGAYFWAIFGSPQANQFIPGDYFPLSANWFFLFFPLSIVLGALTGILLGLPVLRLRGDYLA
ncbi:MAG: ABC transporter permease subunit, partial [Candidatus Binatia bacterium]